MRPFKLPPYSQATLNKAACRQHNQRERARAEQLEDLFAEARYLSLSASERALHRASVNYLLSLCEKQAPEQAAWRGQPQHYAAYREFKQQALGQIAAQYPWLRAETERQNLI